MLRTCPQYEMELNRTLELFLHLLTDFWGERLLSLMLHGSVVFGDLAPGYGDLDFVAVVAEDIEEGTQQALIALRQPLRRGDHGVLAQMIEGAFLSRAMLDPAHAGRAFWWGTSGERPWERNHLGWLVLEVIREHGLVVWGEDLRGEIPLAPREALLQEIQDVCDTMRQRARAGTLHSVDWLLTAARLLLWLREGRFSSKSEAADWGYAHARGAWRELLPFARALRLHPQRADMPDVRLQLEALAEPIRAACEELEQELARLAWTAR